MEALWKMLGELENAGAWGRKKGIVLGCCKETGGGGMWEGPKGGAGLGELGYLTWSSGWDQGEPGS